MVALSSKYTWGQKALAGVTERRYTVSFERNPQSGELAVELRVGCDTQQRTPTTALVGWTKLPRIGLPRNTSQVREPTHARVLCASNQRATSASSISARRRAATFQALRD